MATKKDNLPLTLEQETDSTGTITYANEVVAIIAGVAANEVDGVAGMCSGGGITEVFGRNKLTAGILRACEKRPVSLKQIEQMVDRIEAKIQSMLDREITSMQIGELAMEELKAVDEVSYVRFASVYRQFKDINTFLDELNKLLTEKQ